MLENNLFDDSVPVEDVENVEELSAETPDAGDADAGVVANVEEEEDKLQVAERSESTPQASFAQGILTIPSELMESALREYEKRRALFRGWLLKQLVKGVHYGFPPGCEAKLDDDGNLLQWKKGKGGKPGEYITVPKDQWQVKPSLYKAGAQMICDVLQWRAEFEFDKDAWEQAGSDAGMFTMKCTLLCRITGKVVGEGRGAFQVTSTMNNNAAVKMAEKSALVDAVTNAAALSDLFTQDMADVKPEKKDEPSSPPSMLQRHVIKLANAIWGPKWKSNLKELCTKEGIGDPEEKWDDRGTLARIVTLLEAKKQELGTTVPSDEPATPQLKNTILFKAKAAWGETYMKTLQDTIKEQFSADSLNDLTLEQAGILLNAIPSAK